MTNYEMREAIRKVYDTRSWQNKVDNMYDDQVIAIYLNFEKRGILNKVMKKERPIVYPKLLKEPVQLNIFDYISQGVDHVS